MRRTLIGWRKAAGMELEQEAQVLNIEESVLGKLEEGDKLPSAEFLEELTFLLGIEPDDVIIIR